MLNVSTETLAALKQPAREMNGGVDVYAGSSVSKTFLPSETLVQFAIDRVVPTGKFFGYAISQKLTIELIGKDSVDKGTRVQPYIGLKSAEQAYLPNFFVDSVTIDEVRNKTTIVAYDAISKAKKYTVNDLSITYPITLYNLAAAIATKIGCTLIADFGDLNIELAQATTNFGGEELLSEVLAAIAEVTGTICICSTGYRLVFKDLSNPIVADSMGEESYFSFSTKDAITLTQIASTTQLGDNVSVGEEGYAQAIWDNPFLTLRTNLSAVLEMLAAKVVGMTMVPYDMAWRGNPFYEIGDYLAIDTMSGETKHVYYLNDSMTFHGGLKASCSWEATETENINATPHTVAAALQKTFATVDKVNNQIQMVAGDVTQLTLNTENISASVQKVIDDTNNMMEVTNENIDTLSKKVQASVSAENVTLLVQQEMANGVSSVKTTTGYVFDDEGLTVSKTGSEMTTKITEDGMTVYKDNTAMLTANNTGVKAVNLHATTYLMIGTTSRLEDWQGRTACFWVG